MTKLYLIRHAEAEGNLYRRIHGWYNSLITDRGYLQIAALERRFSDVPIHAVYSSDLYRTMTTAQSIYRPKGLELHTHSGLREIHLGEWEDQTWAEVGRKHPKELHLFSTTSPQFHANGGEDFALLRSRLEAAVWEIVAQHPDQSVAVFCHGTAIRNLLAQLQNISIADSNALPHSDNTAVSLLEFEGDKVHIAFHDDGSHLTPEISTFAKQKWWKQDSSSMEDANMWFRPLDMVEEEDFFRKCRAEAWMNIHGSWEHYDEESFYQDALHQFKRDPHSLQCAMLGDQRAGLLHMDLLRDAHHAIGQLSFVYMCPDFRKRGLGIQLIGQAVSTYRPMERQKLRLRCAPDNHAAQKFYKEHGFHKVAEAEGVRIPLDILEKNIAPIQV